MQRMPASCLQITTSLEANRVSKGSDRILSGSNQVSSQVNENSTNGVLLCGSQLHILEVHTLNHCMLTYQLPIYGKLAPLDQRSTCMKILFAHIAMHQYWCKRAVV